MKAVKSFFVEIEKENGDIYSNQEEINDYLVDQYELNYQSQVVTIDDDLIGLVLGLVGEDDNVLLTMLPESEK